MDGMRLRFLLITLSSLLIFGACSSDTYDFIITSSDPDAVNIENIVTPNDSSEYPHLTQTTDKEWLVLFYIAADTSKKYNSYPRQPNDARFIQMAQIGRGLRKIRLADGKTPKSAYANVTAVGLWDGYNANRDGQDEEKDLQHYLPYTYLFEFKYPDQTYTADISSNYENFTIDVSSDVMNSTNNWLTDTHEANTASGDTLKNFLSWALSKYNSDNSKEVALILTGDSGGSFGDETGTYIPPESRATCRDSSSNSSFLSAPEIVTALSANGFSSSEKLSILILDAAFSASLEDSFEYKDTVLSLVASPSEVPYGAIDFNYLLQCFTKNATPYSIGTSLVNIYANINYGRNQETFKGMSSLSYIDLTQIVPVANNTNMLADKIISLKNTKKIKNNTYSVFDCLTNSDYGFLKYNDEADNYLTDNAMFYKAMYEHEVTDKLHPEATTFFQGYFYQFDLGYLAYKIYRTVASKQGIESIYYYCDEINKSLEKAVVSCWRNGTGSKSGLYPAVESNFRLGLTITGSARDQSGFAGNYLQPYNFSTFSFRDYKETGKESSSNWKELLTELYPEQFQANNYPHYKTD